MYLLFEERELFLQIDPCVYCDTGGEAHVTALYIVERDEREKLM